MLYQPSNITPSSLEFLQSTVAAADPFSVSWQVNGQSPMVAFQIDFYLNDTVSSYVGSTGVISAVTVDDPEGFYGTDEKGNYRYFQYAPPSTTFGTFGLADGNDYKLKITQFYGSSTEVNRTISQSLTAGNHYYFLSGNTYYYFTAPSAVSSGTVLQYMGNQQMCIGAYALGSRAVIVSCDLLSSTPSSGSSASGTNGNANVPFALPMYAENLFYVRTAPSLSIDAFTSPVDKVTAEFSATFSQAQGDSIDHVRWRLAETDGDGNYKVIKDTGDIVTSLLEFSFDGFLSGNIYALRCTVVTEHGVTADTGWISVPVFYAEAVVKSSFTAECLPDGGVLLSWGETKSIPGEPMPADYGSAKDRTLTLNEKASVTWNSVDGANMNFSKPYTVGWKGKISESVQYLPDDVVPGLTSAGQRAAYSPDGKMLVICDNDALRLYSVSGKKLTLILSSDTLYTSARSVCFSPDGKYIALATVTNILIYRVGKSMPVSFLSYSGYAAAGHAVAFSADGKYLYAGILGYISGGSTTYVFKTAEYSFDSESGAATFIKTLKDDHNSDISEASALAVSPDGTRLAIGAAQGIFYYALGSSGASYTDYYGDELNDENGVLALAFSPSGLYLAAGGDFENYLALLSTGGGRLSMIGLSSERASEVRALAFSNGSGLLLAGAGDPEVYTAGASGLFLRGNITEGGSSISSAYFALSPDDNTVLLCGSLPYEYAAFFEIAPYAVLFELNGAAGLWVANDRGVIKVHKGLSTLYSAVVPYGGYTEAVIGLNPLGVEIKYYYRGSLGYTDYHALSYVQDDITSVRMQGEQVANWLYISSNANYDPAGSAASPVDPVWGEDTYFYAAFINGLSGGSYGGHIDGENGIYRYDESTGLLQRIARVGADTLQIIDYGCRSRRGYHWSLFYIDAAGGYAEPIRSADINTCYQAYTLIEAAEDQSDPLLFHVLNVFVFGLNIPASNPVSNNYSPAFQANFTKYPYYQPSTECGRSGVLSSLVGKWDGYNNKYTGDSVSTVDLLFGLCERNNPLFLKDRKGNLYQVAVSSAITQSYDERTRQGETTISIPWQEVGDATDISIVLTPSDGAWKNNAVSSVWLDVDPETGLLSVRYPDNYSGTTFGIRDRGVLYSRTPEGMKVPVFTLDGSKISVN